MILKDIKFLFLILILTVSCTEDEVQCTGELMVTYFAEREGSIGLFDISSLHEGTYWPRYALEIKETSNGSVEFKDLNPGNYVVGFIYSDDPKVVQIKIGQTTVIDL